MNRAEFLFKVMDTICHPLQNYKKYDNIVVERDIVYDNNYPEDCKLNLHYREGAKEYPVVLNIHGGGFVAGDKRHRESISNSFADKGWLVANINYRLGPKHAFPAGTQDVVAALMYLEGIAQEKKLNLNKVVLTGDSAGAYYAMHTYAALKNTELGEKLGIGKINFEVAGLLLFFGPYDIDVAVQRKLPLKLTHSIGESFLGLKIDKDFANLKDYEYLDYISPSSYVADDWCPVFLAYSKKDFFCAGMAESLIERLEEHKIPYQQYFSTKLGDNHCFHLFAYTKQAKKCMESVFAWLEEIKTKE